MNPDRSPTRQVALRLPGEVLARVERHTERLRIRFAGLAVTRTDAFRALLLDALDRAEVQGHPRKGR